MTAVPQHAHEASPQLVQDYATTVTILEHLSDAVFILDSEGIIEYANRNATELLRLSTEDILGNNIMNFLSAEDDSFFSQVVQGVFNEVETLLVNNGFKIPVAVSFGMVYGLDGKVKYIIATAKDLTIKTEFEREWRQHQLMNTLREKYKELGELAVNVVHEISQPLTTIRLMAELTQKNLDKPQINTELIRKNLQTILELTENMGQAVTRVRSFAMQTEDDTLKPVNIGDMIGGAIQQISYELQEQDIEVSLDAEENMPSVLANPIGLQQVFVILFKKEMEWFSAQEQKTTSDKRIYVTVRNFQQKWLDILVSHSLLKAAQDKIDSSDYPAETRRSLDISMAQMLTTMFGGELLIPENGFVVRLPVSINSEREQLLNLIDMMQSFEE